MRIGLSYLRARLFPNADERNFEQWVTNRFGRRLFEIFFKTYTEKVWGMPCTRDPRRLGGAAHQEPRPGERREERAARRARQRARYHDLIDQFHTRGSGPDMMWERCAEIVAKRGYADHLETASCASRPLTRGA